MIRIMIYSEVAAQRLLFRDSFLLVNDYRNRSSLFLRLCDFKKTRHQAKQQQQSSSAKAPIAENVMMADSLVRPATPGNPLLVPDPLLERVEVSLPGASVTLTVGAAVTIEPSVTSLEGLSIGFDG